MIVIVVFYSFAKSHNLYETVVDADQALGKAESALDTCAERRECAEQLERTDAIQQRNIVQLYAGI